MCDLVSQEMEKKIGKALSMAKEAKTDSDLKKYAMSVQMMSHILRSHGDDMDKSILTSLMVVCSQITNDMAKLSTSYNNNIKTPSTTNQQQKHHEFMTLHINDEKLIGGKLKKKPLIFRILFKKKTDDRTDKGDLDAFINRKSNTKLSRYMTLEATLKEIKRGNIIKFLRFFDIKVKDICNDMEDAPIDFLGRGAFGSVFSFQDDRLKGLVVKQMKVRKNEFRSIEFDKDFTTVLLGNYSTEMVMSSLMSKFALNATPMKNNWNKNFPLFDGYFVCPMKLSEFTMFGYLVSEQVDMTYYKFGKRFNNDEIQLDDFETILFQVFFAIVTMQVEYGAIHYDLNKGNVGINLSKPKKNTYLKYTYENTDFYIPDRGITVKLLDFGLSMITKPITMATKSIIKRSLDDTIVGRTREFKPGYDILFFLREAYSLPLNDKLGDYFDELFKLIGMVSGVDFSGDERMLYNRKASKLDYKTLFFDVVFKKFKVNPFTSNNNKKNVNIIDMAYLSKEKVRAFKIK